MDEPWYVEDEEHHHTMEFLREHFEKQMKYQRERERQEKAMLMEFVRRYGWTEQRG